MSASLVGSEMCIRDRHQGKGALEATYTRALVLEEAITRDVPWCGASTDPVSYTHLTLPTICSV
eukprot:8758471-Alexandrium_andersonii.AAC.1